MEDQQEITTEKRENTASTALVLHSMSLAEKANYGLSVGIPSGVAFELFGGGLAGLGVAACLGLAAGFWSEELPGWINWLPAPREYAGSAKSKLAWWLGHTEEQEEGQDEQEEDEPVVPLSRPTSKSVSSERMVDLAKELQMDVDDIAGKAILVCGIRRSGKTTMGVRIAEELGKFNIPMLIPDLKGDWLSLVKTLPNAVILGQGQATEKNAGSHGYAICEEGLQIILDITSFDDMNEVAMVIANMIAGIFLWERKHPDNRRLCAVFLDEAQSFLPQDVKDSIISDTDARDAMLNAYMRTIAIGGSLGLFPVVMTQRIAQTNNKIIGQPELLFLFKQTMDNDLNRYKNFTRIPAEQVRALKQGQGVFVNYEGDSSIHKFHKRTSSDAMSATPRYRPVSNDVSRKRFQADIDDFELENIDTPAEMVPETPRETNRETPEMAPETEAVKVLREIGKRIKEGESIVDIRKSLGVNSGRAVQEINAALAFLQEHMDNEEE
jgi:hypothetical protein